MGIGLVGHGGRDGVQRGGSAKPCRPAREELAAYHRLRAVQASTRITILPK
ncbi:hypothetical protein AX27061_3964 [Achromobacter xylosoxidans NBRC 15126 = ATCC 27061]|nr:hypothetical protein AX27061_3964 [Achromobacter xylosoxidans NBRC 15126 = ATCC 27061]